MRFLTSILLTGLLATVACTNQAGRTAQTQSPTDDDLKLAVQAKLNSELPLKPQLARIEVSANADQNQITLSGTVPSEEARTQAVSLAKLTRPDLTVIDHIDVNPVEVARTDYTSGMAQETQEKAKTIGDKVGKSIDDAWIYTRIEAKLAGAAASPIFKINVDVDGKVVTLRGEVDSYATKQQAAQIAQGIDGVKQVNNLLKVKAS
jgi:hyperosmotically inducible protein